MKNTCRATAFEAGFCLRTKECCTRMDCDRQPACAFSPCLQQNYARKSIWQYRTKSAWRLCTPSACKFPVIFHKNAREYIKYSLRFLFHLTKNLTTHLSHNLCAVLPYISREDRFSNRQRLFGFGQGLICGFQFQPQFPNDFLFQARNIGL